jgi:AcrR family transcriptional regulator
MAQAAIRSDARRNLERVLDSACGVLSKNPAASIEQVAAASGVHRSTVYRRFPTRELLVQALLERALIEVSALVRIATEGEPDEAKLGRMCRDMTSLGERYTFLLMHYRLADLGPDPVGLTKLMRRYQRAGVVRADMSAAWLASAFTAIGTALLDGPEPAKRTADAAADLLLVTFLDGARRPGSRSVS